MINPDPEETRNIGDMARGESRTLGPLPPCIVEAVKRGAKLELVHGPIVETIPNHYERLVQIVLDGESVGDALIGWKERPLPWHKRLWWRLRGAHKRDGMRLEVS
jgi:hypothetical protein